MRGLKSTIALLVVLVGLGAYIYFVTSKQTGDTGSTKEKLFAALEADKIDELRIKSEAGDNTTVKKENGAWKVVAPIQAVAADPEVTSITSALSNAEIERVVDENPTDLKQYGLDAPRIEVEFKKSGGQPGGKVAIGAKTATGSNLYAQRDGEKRVLLIPQYQETSLNKTTFDMRDKTIMKFDRNLVDGVDITSGNTAVELAKSDGQWKLVKPIAARADSSLAEAFVGRIETGQMRSIASANPTPADLEKYGLAKPSSTVNIHLGSARATLLVGGKADDMSFYAKDASRPDVFLIDTSLNDDVKKPGDEYRSHEMFEFRAFNATRVEITQGGQAVVFERVKSDKADEADKWRRVSPNPGEPDRQKVESLLAGLADIRATAFPDAKTRTGLDAPVMTVVAKFDEGKKEERVTFGKSGDDAYAMRAGDPGPGKIDAEKLTETMKSLDELSK